MIAVALQSGSNGNCIYVEAGGTGLLFDAGISGVRVSRRLAGAGRDVRSVRALILSHEHADHVRCAGGVHRKFGLSVCGTEAALAKVLRRSPRGGVGEVRCFRAGETIEVDGVAVRTIPTAHDAAGGAAFVVEGDGKRLGILTDLGHVFAGLADVVRSLDAVFLESNYDAAMLEAGPYPAWLKARIRGPGGHLSNLEAAELLCRWAGPRLRWACLAHLSEQNNHPEVALATHRRVGPALLPRLVAGRCGPTEVLQV